MEKRGEGRVKEEGLKRDLVSTPRGTKSQNLITVRLDVSIDTFFGGYNLNSNLLPQNTLHSFSSEVKQNIHSNHNVMQPKIGSPTRQVCCKISLIGDIT